MRRGLALWLVLFGAYAATLGLHDSGAPRITAAEAHRLLVADSIVHDGNLDVADEYRQRAWTDFYDGRLRPAGRVVSGRRVEPAGIGTPLVIAPAYALGGATMVELWCAALLALAFVLGAAIARRVVPDPWPTRAALLCGLSPPALVTSTTIAPEPAVAVLVTAAALLALRSREHPRIAWAAGAGALLAPLHWLSLRAIAPGAVVLLALARWMGRRQRGLAALVGLEVVLVSAVLFISINDRLYGGLTPASARAAGPITGTFDPVELLLAVRWTPVLGLAGLGMWLLWRSRRDHLAVVASDQIDVETTALLCASLVGATLAIAPFAPNGSWLVAPILVTALPAAAGLVAWGLRFAPRAGALLALATLAQSAWLLARL